MAFKLWRGVVEDNKDPEMRGRVKVRVLGEGSLDTKKVPVDVLPWAEVAMPNLFGGISGVGMSSVIVQGAWVWGFYEDGQRDRPVVLAVSPGVSQKKEEGGATDPEGIYPREDRFGPDYNVLGRTGQGGSSDLEKTLQKNKKTSCSSADGVTFSETTTNNAGAKYPYNHIIETQSGHTIMMDDTAGNERVMIFHKTGSYIEIDKEGNVTFKSVKNTSQFTDNGSHNTYVNADKNFAIGRCLNIATGAKSTQTFGGNLKVTAPMIYLN